MTAVRVIKGLHVVHSSDRKGGVSEHASKRTVSGFGGQIQPRIPAAVFFSNTSYGMQELDEEHAGRGPPDIWRR